MVKTTPFSLAAIRQNFLYCSQIKQFLRLQFEDDQILIIKLGKSCCLNVSRENFNSKLELVFFDTKKREISFVKNVF